MSDQAERWSGVAKSYETEFIDPYLPEVRNPLPIALERISGRGSKTIADLGCGVGPLVPLLAKRFRRVYAIDFAEGMLARARERCAELENVEFLRLGMTDLSSLAGRLDVAVAVNSLVLPDDRELETALQQIHAALRPGGRFLGIVPAIDAVHYFTMLLVDRARQVGMPVSQARKNAAHHAEHSLYDFAFGDFRYQGIEQHFWQPFEVKHRLRRAGFRRVRLKKVRLAWHQFGCSRDLGDLPAPWDWFFQARRD
jgi:SAM-dependent methyltransferase